MSQGHQKALAPHVLGHCLYCDIAHVVNAWIENGKLAPADMVIQMLGVLAYVVVNGAKEGHELTVIEDVHGLLRKKVQALIQARQMDEKSPHQCGHA